MSKLKVWARIPAFTIDQAILSGDKAGPPTLPVMDLAGLTRQVRRLEGLGVDGVLLADHLFVSHGGPRPDSPTPPEPMTVLAAIGAISPALTLGTIVMNLSINEPVLLFRQFAQLAQLYGGGRVLAGVGAGWNPEEFDAIGRQMPPYNDRVGRLEEALAIARSLYDEGVANVEGEYLVARELPVSPRAAVPPRILLGGGSDRVLELAGRYADALDLNGSSRRAKLSGPQPHNVDTRRRLTTTLEDLEDSVARVRAASIAAGRGEHAVAFSIYLNMVRFGDAAAIEQWRRGLCSEADLDYRDIGSSPYVLSGEPAAVAERLQERIDRLELSAIIVNAGPELDVLCSDVLPLLRQS